MATLTAKQKKQVQTIVENFEADAEKKTDYARMHAELVAIGLKPKNEFIWYCVNKVEATTESYDLDFLD